MTSMDDDVVFATLIELADTTTTGFNLVGLADRLVRACVEVLGVTAAGIMLADHRQRLRVFASSNEETRILELFELQNNDGPCLEAFRTGEPVEGTDLSLLTARWPHFAAAAMSAGFNTAYAVPMRLRGKTIGALNLFQAGIETFSTRKVSVARVLADMAAIGIVNHGSLRQQEVLAQQLQGALNSRVIIEQAKGFIAERQGVSLPEAFDYLRATARASQRPIADVALEVVTAQGAAAGAASARSETGTPPAHEADLPHSAGGPALHSSAGVGPVANAGGATLGGATALESSATPGLVGLRERLIEPAAETVDPLETALELVRGLYQVNLDDARSLLSEASRALNCSLGEIATRVITDSQLPEQAILRARLARRQGLTEEPDPT
jgi:ANTAR domain-containing protein/GAF domain-containing protein